MRRRERLREREEHRRSFLVDAEKLRAAARVCNALDERKLAFELLLLAGDLEGAAAGVGHGLPGGADRV